MTYYTGSCSGIWLGAHAVVCARTEKEARALMDEYARNYGVELGQWEITELSVTGEQAAMLYFDNGDY